MLIPQFSIRWLLGLTVVCAVIFSIVGLAVRGSRWAMGMSIGIGSLVLLMAVYAGMFFLVWVASQYTRRRGRGSGRSPFSQGPPPAVVLALAVLLFPAGRCCLGQNPAFTHVSGDLVKASGSGLTMTIDTRWLDNAGYRPVRIVVTPTAPVTADRTLTVQVVFQKYRNRDIMRVSKDIEIPAGSGPVRTTIPVPQLPDYDSCSINVLEDGTLLSTLSRQRIKNWGQWQEIESPYVLIVSDRPAETHELAKSLLPYGIPDPFDSDSSDPNPPLPTAMSVGLEDLTEGWINYTSLDVICISLPRLAKLAKQRPDVFEAVTSWAAAGGNLWVYGVGPDWRGLPELEELAGLSPPGGTDSAAPAARGWIEPDKHFFTPRPMIWPPVPEEKAPVEPPPEPPERPHFVSREYDLGMIVALAPEDPFPGTKWGWRWVLVTMGRDRALWCDRHGLSMRGTNDDYWNFLIPGVGLAPVTGFCILISLFVLVIGPVNYLVLRRLRRLYLLAITIPAAAAAVTFILFGYALIADGLGTRVRVRSVTQIDQRRGHAVCWARLSYYAGLAPVPAKVSMGSISCPAGNPTGLKYGTGWVRRSSGCWFARRTGNTIGLPTLPTMLPTVAPPRPWRRTRPTRSLGCARTTSRIARSIRQAWIRGRYATVSGDGRIGITAGMGITACMKFRHRRIPVGWNGRLPKWLELMTPACRRWSRAATWRLSPARRKSRWASSPPKRRPAITSFLGNGKELSVVSYQLSVRAKPQAAEN
jgi:hypothetical protein